MSRRPPPDGIRGHGDELAEMLYGREASFRARMRNTEPVKAAEPPPRPAWKDEPATRAQKGMLLHLGYSRDVLEGLTKGAASQMITDAQQNTRG